jgi:hypothetical protein
MFRRVAALVCALGVLALGVGVSGPARAGVYSDDLAKCLVKAASPTDVSVFVVWMFSAMTLQPDVKPYSSMTDAQRDEAGRRAAALLQRLMVVDCHTETVAAIKYEGVSSLETGFNVFGQVAGRGLIASPAVAANLQKMATYFDKPKFEALAKEAGLAPAKP